MALTNEQILDAVAELKVIELVDLIKAFEERFNVSAAAVAVAAGPAAARRRPGLPDQAVRGRGAAHPRRQPGHPQAGRRAAAQARGRDPRHRHQRRRWNHRGR